MLSERLTEVISLFDLKIITIAEIAGVDRTYISHLKSGKRISPANSSTMTKLLHGLLECAKQTDKTDALCALTGADPKSDDASIIAALRSYLYEGMTDNPKKQRKKRKRAQTKSFGEKLNKVVTLAGISNARLARILNVDASLISRYRSGVRMPRMNSDVMETAKNTLWESIQKKDALPQLAKEIRLPVSRIDEEVFSQWLFGSAGDEMAAASLIDTFESFSMPEDLSLPPLEAICPDTLLDDDSQVYYGIRGLQTAVLRFLGTVIKRGADEIFLYSDQNMEWMVGDAEFRKKWSLLMFMTVKSGIKIRIIHNIDRGLDEMNEAIQNWLPLYMSGVIEPYYCKNRIAGGFNHSIFLCPGIACVESMHIKGMEKTAPYNYHTDARRLKAMEKEYNLIMDNANALITFSASDEDEDDVSEKSVIIKDNTRITVCHKYVRIVPLSRPDTPFYFRHPLMCRAFMNYAKSIGG